MKNKTLGIIIFRTLGYLMLIIVGAGIVRHDSLVVILGALFVGHISIQALIELEKTE